MIKSEILKKICIALNANDVDAMSKLVESAFDVGHTVEEIKEAARDCMARPGFDVICEFCRAMHFEENRRTKRELKKMDKYCKICKLNELLTTQEKTNQVCNVCFGKMIAENRRTKRR